MRVLIAFLLYSIIYNKLQLDKIDAVSEFLLFILIKVTY